MSCSLGCFIQRTPSLLYKSVILFPYISDRQMPRGASGCSNQPIFVSAKSNILCWADFKSIIYPQFGLAYQSASVELLFQPILTRQSTSRNVSPHAQANRWLFPWSWLIHAPSTILFLAFTVSSVIKIDTNGCSSQTTHHSSLDSALRASIAHEADRVSGDA
jgi:hypothetical protein